MKITLNNISPYRMETVGHARTDGKVSGGPKGNYDALTIQSSSRQIQEKTFSEALSKQVVCNCIPDAGERGGFCPWLICPLFRN